MLKGKLLVAQGGGPTAVINQSLVGVVQQARVTGAEAIYGARHGVRGIVDEDFVDLTGETEATLEGVAATPGSALGTTRDKPDAAYCAGIFRSLQAHGIGTFLYIGGNDSADTVRIVGEEAARAGHDLNCIHVPKTIDNDLMVTDHCPGYASAARFVAGAFTGVNQDNRALPGVYIGIVMGRHAGFLTAASALGRVHPDDGPHIICLPEQDFDMAAFTARVREVHNRLGRCIVAVSEGIHDASGELVAASLAGEVERDAHGNVQLSGSGALGDLLVDAVKAGTGIARVRGDTFGYLQRSFPGVVSDVDRREAREVGVRGVRFAGDGDGNTTGSVTIHRTGNYAVDYRLSPLVEIAGKTRIMPDEFIDRAAWDVTPAFHDYLAPLLGSGLPEPVRLEAPRVPKILGG